MILLLLLAAASSTVHAWGSRGHAIICESAAYLLAEDHRSYLKDKSYDLAYYCNVPDLVWKATHYEVEGPEHFADLDVFSRSAPEKEWSEDRRTFFAKHPDIPEKAGRAPWRIAELHAHAMALAKRLGSYEGASQGRKQLQLQWLTTIGALGHYVGDLAQPLHVTESYDGQATGQKGIHVFFETTVLNELFPGLSREVFKQAQKRWKKKPPSCESAFSCTLDLARESFTQIKPLLEIDRKTGRASLPRASRAFHDLIVDRLAIASVTLAALWRIESDFEFDSDHFFTIEGSPQYLPAQPSR